MHVRNRNRLIIFFVLITLLLFACKSASNEITQTPIEPAIIEKTDIPAIVETVKPTPPEPVDIEDIYQNTDPTGQVVTFWHPFSHEDEEVLQEIIGEFNSTNEWNITVVAEHQGTSNDVFNKMLTFMNTANAPNLVAAYQHQSATYQLGEALINIDELVYSEKWGLSKEEIDDFFPGPFYQDLFPSFNNMRLGFPPNRSMVVLYYNLDWLAELGYDAPPTTPTEFKEMSCAAAAQPFSGATAEGRIGYQLSTNASQFASFTFAFGGDIFDDEINQFTYDSPEAVEAMEFIQGLIKDGCASLVTELYGDQTKFSQGTTLFTVGSSSSLFFYQDAVKSGSNHNWSVAPIPYVTDKPIQNTYGASISVPTTSPETQLAAWLFLKYLTNTENQAKLAQASSYFPVRASTADRLGDYFAANPVYETAFSLMPFGTTEPPAAGYDFIRDMVAEAMYAISLGADTVTVLTTLNDDANAYLIEQLALIPEVPDPWADIDPSGQTITFWHQQRPAKHDALNELIWKFNSTNNWGITVVPEYQDATSKNLQSVINTSDAPELVEIYQTQTADLQLTNTFSDMTSLVESIKWGFSPQDQQDFIPGIFLHDIYPTFGDIRLGFPPHRNMIVMYYNAEWLAELKASGAIDFEGPPQNPEQFKLAACAASANAFSGSLMDHGIGYDLKIDASTLASWAFARGGDVFDYETNKYSFNNQGVVAAMTVLQEFLDDGCANIVVERYGDQINFGLGATLFTVGSSSEFSYYQRDIDEGAQFNWSVAPIPYTSEQPVMNLYGTSISLPVADPEAQLASWLFLKYFTSSEVQNTWAQASNYFPVRASVADGLTESGYFAANPAYASAFDLLQYGTSEPPVPGYDFVRGMVEEAMAAIVDGADIQSTLDQLTEDANINLAEQLEQ